MREDIRRRSDKLNRNGSLSFKVVGLRKFFTVVCFALAIFSSLSCSKGTQDESAKAETGGSTTVVTNSGSEGIQIAEWVDRTPSVAASQFPPAGEDCAMIYDPGSHRIVLFGGKDDDDVNLNDVWTFDLESNEWRVIETGGEKPEPSEDHSLIYDPAGYRMILFGGENGPTRNDTWSFDLKTHEWRDITDSEAPRREDHTATYVTKRMFVYGGQDNDVYRPDLWMLNLDPESDRFEKWAEVKIPGEQPPLRSDHVAVYDDRRKRLLIYGGWDDGSAQYLDDTWAFVFKSGSWEKINTEKARPPRRRHAQSAYDSHRGIMIIFGGFGEEGYLNDAWAFRLKADVWINITPGPAPRMDHQLIFDPKSGNVLLYGGDARLQTKFHDLWELQPRRGLPAFSKPMVREPTNR